MSVRTPPPEHPSCRASDLSWSGIFECLQDGLSALRLVSIYATSQPYQEKVDSIAECANELVDRLERLRCLPAVGEPSFTLLARDPQAASRVEDWIAERERTSDGSPKTVAKIEEARRIAATMRTFAQRTEERLLETTRTPAAPSQGPA